MSSIRKSRSRRRGAVAGAFAAALTAFLLAGGIVACGSGSGSDPVRIVGAGSTAQEIAQENWISEFENKRPHVEVTYEAIGSGPGRERFIAGDAAYAASDTPLEGAELQQAVEHCKPGQLVEVPAYLSKVVVVVHLSEVRFVDLSPRTLAMIVAGEITSWSDPRSLRQNPSLTSTQLHGPITVIYPAGESGTTAVLTEYLSEAAPDVWHRGSSETWPVPDAGMPVQEGDELLKAIRSREGTIAFLDASRSGRLKPVLIRTGGDVTGPNRASSIAVLESSPEAKALKKSPYMMPFDLDRTKGGAGTYPIVFTSYLIACTHSDSGREALAVREFIERALYFLGQEAAEREAGADQLVGRLKADAETAAWPIG